MHKRDWGCAIYPHARRQWAMRARRWREWRRAAARCTHQSFQFSCRRNFFSLALCASLSFHSVQLTIRPREPGRATAAPWRCKKWARIKNPRRQTQRRSRWRCWLASRLMLHPFHTCILHSRVSVRPSENVAIASQPCFMPAAAATNNAKPTLILRFSILGHCDPCLFLVPPVCPIARDAAPAAQSSGRASTPLSTPSHGAGDAGAVPQLAAARDPRPAVH